MFLIGLKTTRLQKGSFCQLYYTQRYNIDTHTHITGRGVRFIFVCMSDCFCWWTNPKAFKIPNRSGILYIACCRPSRLLVLSFYIRYKQGKRWGIYLKGPNVQVYFLFQIHCINLFGFFFFFSLTGCRCVYTAHNEISHLLLDCVSQEQPPPTVKIGRVDEYIFRIRLSILVVIWRLNPTPPLNELDFIREVIKEKPVHWEREKKTRVFKTINFFFFFFSLVCNESSSD